MTRICFVTTIYSTYHSFLKQYSEYLYQSGEYDISLICDGNSVDKIDIPEYVHLFPVTMKRGVSLSGIKAVMDIERILKEQKFDIVQYSTPNAAFYTSVAAKCARIPVRLYCQWGIRYMGFEGWKRLVFKALEKITCMNSTFIEAESHNIRQFSLDEKLYTPERSCVIWNGSASGVDMAKFDLTQKDRWRKELRTQYGFGEEDIVFAFAGRLTADKGINELLEAFLAITREDARAKLLIMGRMDNQRSLNSELYDQAKASKAVTFTGSVSDIERYYAASDVFVAPSYREGFGLVVVEAEAMELPAIVSDVPGQIDAIDEGVSGIACRVKDAASLQKAMEMLLNDDALRDRLARGAGAYARENYEQKQLFEKLMQHRTELVRGAR